MTAPTAILAEDELPQRQELPALPCHTCGGLRRFDPADLVQGRGEGGMVLPTGLWPCPTCGEDGEILYWAWRNSGGRR